jgi:hypothetical protein
MVVAGAVVAVSVLALVSALLQGRGEDSSVSPGPSVASHGSRTGGPAVIELDPLPAEVPRMRPVPLTGVARGLPSGTRLVVQDATGSGTWRSFPLRPVVDGHGRFRTHVELGAAGVHRVRVVEPGAVRASAVLLVRATG